MMQGDVWGVKSIPNTMGVYMIQNQVDGRFYIGSSIKMRQRFKGHVSALYRGNHPCIEFQHAWNTHRPTDFEFRILNHVKSESEIELRNTELAIMKSYGYPHNPAAYSTTMPLAMSRTYRDPLRDYLLKIGYSNIENGDEVKLASELLASRYGLLKTECLEMLLLEALKNTETMGKQS